MIFILRTFIFLISMIEYSQKNILKQLHLYNAQENNSQQNNS